MDADAFVDRVSDRTETQLSRLGSSKALYAVTQGELEADRVRAAAQRSHYHALETFQSWAEADPGDAGTLWSGAATTERTVLDRIGDPSSPGEPPSIQTVLRSFESPVARVGGVVGWAIATTKTTGQMTGFFVGQADPRTADTFRSVREDIESQLDGALEFLATAATDEDDWSLAESAAVETIEAGYNEYVTELESLGVNPKPVC